jgi:SAM-dependent methyltransferase
MKQMKDYWNEQQDKFDKNSDVQFIANSVPEKIWEFLKVKQFLNKGTKVLNIGVGTGRDTFALSNLGVELSVLDISPKALDRVKKIATGYEASRVANLPINHFDLVISHLVSQHMNDKDILKQFHHVIKSLTKKGIFALQFAWAEGCVVGSEEIQKAGESSRYLSRMEYLVDKAGGKVVKVLPPILYKDILWDGRNRDVFWFGIHISKK